MRTPLNTTAISRYLSLIQDEYGAGGKATVIVRTPGDPEKDLLLGDDTLDGIQEVLERSRKRPEVDIFGKSVSKKEKGVPHA